MKTLPMYRAEHGDPKPGMPVMVQGRGGEYLEYIVDRITPSGQVVVRSPRSKTFTMRFSSDGRGISGTGSSRSESLEFDIDMAREQQKISNAKIEARATLNPVCGNIFGRYASKKAMLDAVTDLEQRVAKARAALSVLPDDDPE